MNLSSIVWELLSPLIPTLKAVWNTSCCLRHILFHRLSINQFYFLIKLKHATLIFYLNKSLNTSSTKIRGSEPLISNLNIVRSSWNSMATSGSPCNLEWDTQISRIIITSCSQMGNPWFYGWVCIQALTILSCGKLSSSCFPH
jgi:hypothetical protein